MCLSIGLYPLIYFIIERTFGLLRSKPDWLLNDVLWNIMFYTHIIFGGISLLVGWSQFSKKWRAKHIHRHRQIGKLYVFAVLLSGVSGLYIAYYATGGLIPVLGFMSMDVIWLTTTIMAFFAIKNGKVKKHQRLMIISYAACFSAVTLRIWLPILTSLLGGFTPAYRIVAWLSWIPNVIVAYFMGRKIV
jgi:uncharacterized membrane protein